MLEIFIQNAKKSDAERINQVMKAAFKEYEKAASFTAAKGALSETVFDTMSDIETKYFLKAVCDGDIVGSVRVSKDKNCAYLSRFSVLPEYQRYGIGHLLMEAVDELMKSVKCSSLMLHTCTDATHLVAFYKKSGFEITDISNDRGYNRGTFIKKYE